MTERAVGARLHLSQLAAAALVGVTGLVGLLSRGKQHLPQALGAATCSQCLCMPTISADQSSLHTRQGRRLHGQDKETFAIECLEKLWCHGKTSKAHTIIVWAPKKHRAHAGGCLEPKVCKKNSKSTGKRESSDSGSGRVSTPEGNSRTQECGRFQSDTHPQLAHDSGGRHGEDVLGVLADVGGLLAAWAADDVL